MLNGQVMSGCDWAGAGSLHSAAKALIAHPPTQGVQRQVSKMKCRSSQIVVQITLVSTRRNLSRAQHGSRHIRQSARD